MRPVGNDEGRICFSMASNKDQDGVSFCQTASHPAQSGASLYRPSTCRVRSFTISGPFHTSIKELVFKLPITWSAVKSAQHEATRPSQ